MKKLTKAMHLIYLQIVQEEIEKIILKIEVFKIGLIVISKFVGLVITKSMKIFQEYLL